MVKDQVLYVQTGDFVVVIATPDQPSAITFIDDTYSGFLDTFSELTLQMDGVASLQAGTVIIIGPSHKKSKKVFAFMINMENDHDNTKRQY